MLTLDDVCPPHSPNSLFVQLKDVGELPMTLFDRHIHYVSLELSSIGAFLYLSEVGNLLPQIYDLPT